jgi:glyoxylase-like metal-dependent hydrolase (beta-lactamase superfamily II)
MKNAIATLLAAALTATGSLASTPSASASAPEGLHVGRFASPNPGSVNTYWIQAPQGLILVDTLRTLTDARNALARVQETGQPIVAILLTHSHPDHVGGAGVFHDAFPWAPIYASTRTAKAMREDKRGFYDLQRSLPNADYPDQLTYPDKTFKPGASVKIGGLTLQTTDFVEGESDASTVYYEARSRSLFTGDLVGNRVTPALLEGHSCGWLVHLDRISTRFAGARRLYPGHGGPGTPGRLITAQRTYLKDFRALVKPAVRATSKGGSRVTATERRSIIVRMNRAYPNHPNVASLPTMMEENVKAVAAELRTTKPAELPAACR